MRHIQTKVFAHIVCFLVVIGMSACDARTGGSHAPEARTGGSHAPVAEYEQAKLILMYTPGEELFDGVIHPDAALYEGYFDLEKAAAEHQNYISMLQANHIEVKTVRDILMAMPEEQLTTLAKSYLIYDIADTQLDSAKVEAYRDQVLSRMSQADKVRVLMRHPRVELHETDLNTGLRARYIHEPLMNMYFMRDQSINTPCGPVLCRMNSAQRYPEVEIVEACYQALGIDPVYRIQGEDSYLEGGDYIPFGTMALIGQGLRTTQAALDELMQHDVLGHDTLVVVRDHWQNQYQMHLDTYFNIIDADLATMCYNRYDASDESNPHFLTIDMYARPAGEKTYHEVAEYQGYSFRQFLSDRGVQVIRVSREDADHYANNYLTVDARHILSVANQSQALQDEYRRHKVQVEWVPLENLIQGYGAAHCMTQVILRSNNQ